VTVTASRIRTATWIACRHASAKGRGPRSRSAAAQARAAAVGLAPPVGAVAPGRPVVVAVAAPAAMEALAVAAMEAEAAVDADHPPAWKLNRIQCNGGQR
jgi:hypothetical protein